MGVDQVPKLPGFATPSGDGSGGAGREVAVARLEPQAGLMPGRWYGYDAAEAIVIDTDDRDLEVARRARGARRSSTGSGAAGTWSSPSGRTGRRSATACCGPILPAPADRPGAGHLARGARHVRRLHQADHPPRHAAGHGDEARGGRGARGQGPQHHRQPARWSSAARTGSAG